MLKREQRDELRRVAAEAVHGPGVTMIAVNAHSLLFLLDDRDAAEKRAKSAEDAAEVLADAETRRDAWEAMARELAVALADTAVHPDDGDGPCWQTGCIASGHALGHSCMCARARGALARFHALESGQ